MIRSTKITKAARGERCTLEILGVCNHNTETTVLAHLPSVDRGIGIKSSDLCSCFACSCCHDAIDRRVISTELEDRRWWYLYRAVVRTIERLFELGVVKL